MVMLVLMMALMFVLVQLTMQMRPATMLVCVRVHMLVLRLVELSETLDNARMMLQRRSPVMHHHSLLRSHYTLQ